MSIDGQTYDASTTEERSMPEFLKPLAEQLAAYISNEILRERDRSVATYGRGTERHSIAT